MYAQCPECLTVFSFDAETVAQAHGTVACGKCGATFDCLPTLTEQLPEETYETLPVHPSSPAPPVLMMSVVRAGPEDSVQAPLFAHAPPAAEDEDDAPAGMPSFARLQRLPQRTTHRVGRWAAVCGALALVLAAQLVWAERRPLTANPNTRPWMQTLCGWLGCTLPPVADLSKLELISRDVRPHPSVPGALIISATVRNDASFTQPYPVVAITLSDLDGNRIAMRRFRPSDYLDDPAAQSAGLAAGASASLVFEVKDPGKKAVAFEFSFQ
ncbi:zinc-ribbon and DUF3426 domain-containing protein [Oleiagrimonas sp. MCCC 1A03011]|uniref:zinc-ribbon and DUF3426 domain-containing protein n=1 Tax=Oleiagrimonas sp. MCCC 1A03011 TaxID=1926883 RepID=UPI000DC24716|nr:zinc-ribbon and DUF3426 domain-containing protein [Oleiagrimonas sp. MCCC 1A03011]RAP58225.1 hypothetical protein BTJ49_04425 [Oleiagrimonas sp. MCCC 1A03011]